MAASADDVTAFGYRQELHRTLGPIDLLAYGLVFIVPMAPVATFGIVYNLSHGMPALVYAIGLVAMTFTALSYSAMAEAFPVAGSVYAYAARSLGSTVGYFAGWAILLDYFLGPTINYVAAAIAVHAAIPAIPNPACVVAMLIVATVVNYLGIETTARANMVLLALELAILVLFLILGGLGLVHHVAGARLSLSPVWQPGQVSPQMIFGALSLAVLSFLGFDAISTLSEESRGGGKAVGRATLYSLCLAAVLFVAQTWLASLFVLGTPRFPSGLKTNESFYTIAELVGGYAYKFVLTVPGAFLAAMAGAIAAQSATSRLIFGMARDGELPRALAHVDPKRKTPARALFLVSGVTLVTSLLLVNQLELLASMVSFGALLGFLLLHVSVIAHFVWRQKSRRWLRHLVTPAIGFLIIGYVLFNAETNAKIAGFAWLAAGVVMFATLKLTHRPVRLPEDEI
jgi:amino acid transporter